MTKTQITYDSYGNPTREYLDGSDTSAHSNIERTFHTNATDWIVALPKWEKLRAGHTTGGTLASHTQYYYDGSNNLNTTPSVGNLTKVRAYDTATTYVDTIYTYDAGRVKTVTDPESNTTTTVYDSTFGYPEKVTNPELESTETVADPGTGAPLSTKDPAGFTTEYEYDTYNRLVAVELSGDDTDDYLFDYSPGARPARVKTRQLVEESPAVWIDSYAYVDGFGRAVQTQANHETSGQRIVTATWFDPRGQAHRVSVPWQASGNAGTGWVDPTWTGSSPSMPQQTVATYDRLGRITLSEVLRSNGNLLHDTEVDFDGSDQTVTDPRGADTTYEYDAFGNLKKVTDDNNFTTTYTNTTRLELDTVTRDGEVTDVDYDLLGRKTSLDDPDMGEWSYTYFDNGWLKTQTDARNTTLTFAYDDAGRTTTKKYGTTTIAQWTYDTAGRLDQTKSWTDTGGIRVTIDHDYETAGTDKRGRLIQSKWTTQGFGHGTDTYTIDYTYDNADRAYQIDLPTGETVTTDYDTRSGMPIGLDGDDTYLDDATWNGQRRLTYGWSQEGTNAKLYRRWEWSSTTLQLWRIRAGTTSWGTQVADVRHWWTGAGDVTRGSATHATRIRTNASSTTSWDG